MNNNKKELKDFTFDELVDYCAEKILCELMCGKFRSGVWTAVDIAARWRDEQNEKDKKRKK
jgi:hypothetical protein